ncbi:MAG TPA: cytochrome P450 [Kofleriaceae bacterium]|nr:cytochrome P450 [Kofleriaceae bacterium]
MAQLQPPPGSTGLPFLGEALAFLKDPFTFQAKKSQKHGLLWKTKILGSTVVFFNGPKAFSFFLDPENFTRENGSPPHLRELLHPDAVPFIDGDRHRARKRLLLAAFTPEALTSYLPSLERVMKRYVERWSKGDELGMNKELAALAFDIANVLFAGADPETSDTKTGADFDVVVKGAFSPPVKLPFTAYGKALKARDRLRVYIKDAVATRGGAGTALGALKAARGPKGDALTQAELEIELLHFFFAAHGGITAVFAWLLVVFGTRPDVLAKVKAEVDAMPAGPLTLDAVHALRYTTAVGREVRRVYPVAPATFFGVAKKDLEYGGHVIKQGWTAVGAIWNTLQDGATFQDPAKLDPERMTDAAFAKLPDNAFVPQGGGPPDGHRCAGEALTDLLLPMFAAVFARAAAIDVPTQDLTPGAGGLGPLPKDGLRARVRALK